ncbi:MAG: M6 family metalloprotease domain-containing protein [Candidatus Eisenbacteria bacterium]
MRHSSRRAHLRGLLAVAAVALLVAAPAGAAPLTGDSVTIRQTDGTNVELRVWGDEFYAVGETPDGYTVVRDPETGLYCYARLSHDGTELVSTGVPVTAGPAPADLERHVRVSADAARARARASRESFEQRALESFVTPPDPAAKSRGTTMGEVEGITLIIDFSDDVATIPASSIENYCNLQGYTGYSNNGSVRDYFDDVSGGLLDYTNYVPTAYYRAANTKAYYTDAGVSYGTRARQLITEALEALDAAGFDFSQYDADGNGKVDALNCFYAGNTWNNWAEGLWPHAGWMQWCRDGVCTERYQISNLGSSLRLGTFCHENGHMLMGWPDLYDYDGDSAGVGQFCLMCSVGPGTNPIEPSAYMKYTAGWATVYEPAGYQNGLQAPSDGNVVYKFDHPTLANEYYLIENRQRSGRDSSIPDHGLAIWHVDEYGSNSWQQQTPENHYEVTLVQADGDWDLENNRNYGDSYDLYAATQYTDCTPLTYPHTDWWDGSESNLFFMDVSSSGSMMTFDFADGPPFNPTFTAPVYALESSRMATVAYAVTLLNPGNQAGTAEVEIAFESLPDGVGPTDWIVSFREVGGPWLTTPTIFSLGAAEEVELEVRVEDTIGTVEGMAVAGLTGTSTSDPDATNTCSFATFFDVPSILIVDDDNGAANEAYLETALADTGYSGHVHDANSRGRPTAARLSSYWAVFWTTAQSNATHVEADDEQAMIDYLDQGGNLFLASTDYLTGRPANTFTSDYLHIDSWVEDAGGFSVVGVPGDQVSDGMSLMLLAGPVQTNLADTIVPLAPAEAVFATTGGDVKGLKVSENDHKLVFLAFAFENVKTATANPSNQKTLVARVIDWFQDSTGVDESEGVGTRRLALGQNYPNPFNPNTRIAFTVPSDVANATLRVFNVTGQVVRTLIDGPISAGEHAKVWDGTDDAGSNLASGIYFAKLEAGGESALTKMALLK